MPPNTLATHLNNLRYHSGVRHPPQFYPQGLPGFNVWTPSRPGYNHAWHINNLRGGAWGVNNYPGWGRQNPSLLQAAISNPYKFNLLPFNRNLLYNSRSPVLTAYDTMNSGVVDGRLFQRMPPHLPMWQYYQRKSPGFRYLALSTPPSPIEQLRFRQPTRQTGNPGAFPFGPQGAIDPMNPNSPMNMLPRSTLQRVTDGIGSMLGRRSPVAMEGPPPMPGFPAGQPRGFPTEISVEGPARPGPFNGVRETREAGEARSMLAGLRTEIQRYVQANSPLLPATERMIGMLIASIDDLARSPTLNRSHAQSSRMFWQSIVDMDMRARSERGAAAPTFGEDEPEETPAEEETTR